MQGESSLSKGRDVGKSGKLQVEAQSEGYW